MRRLPQLCALVTVAVVALLSGPLCAQDLVQPTAAQLQLNDQAYQAFVDEDWDRAIRLYQALLDLGPLNTAYASLGYALFKAGRCEEARAAYDLAETAPQVVDPPPEAVQRALGAYRDKLSDSCPGYIVLECRPKRMQISLDGSPLAPCSPNPIPVARGDHVVIGAAGDESMERAVYVESMESVTLSLVIDGVEDEVVEVTPAPHTPAPSAPSRPLSLTGTLGWITAGVGGAVLATALAVDLFVLDATLQDLRQASASNDTARYDSLKPSAESQQSLVQGLVISGGALVATGATLYLIDVLGADEVAPGVTVAPTLTGAVLEFRW